MKIRFPKMSNRGVVKDVGGWLLKLFGGEILDRKAAWDENMSYAAQGRLRPEIEEWNMFSHAMDAKEGRDNTNPEEFEQIYGMSPDEALRRVDTGLIEQAMNNATAANKRMMGAKYNKFRQSATGRSARAGGVGGGETTRSLRAALEELRDYSEKQIERDRERWNKGIGSAIDAWREGRGEAMDFFNTERGDWRSRREGILADIGKTVESEKYRRIVAKDALDNLRQENMNLLRDIREAPSTVAEQARIESDRAFAEDVAIASAMGGGMAGQSNMLKASQGRLADRMSNIGGLMLQEQDQRRMQELGVLGSLLGVEKQGSVERDRMFEADAFRHRAAVDLERIGSQEWMFGSEFLAGLGEKEYDILRDKALMDIGMSDRAYKRESGLYDRGFGIAEMDRRYMDMDRKWELLQRQMQEQGESQTQDLFSEWVDRAGKAWNAYQGFRGGGRPYKAPPTRGTGGPLESPTDSYTDRNFNYRRSGGGTSSVFGDWSF